MPGSRAVDLKHIVRVLFRYKLTMAAFIVSSLIVVAAVSYLRTPTYEATAQILVKVGREISAPSQDIPDGGGFVIQKRKEDIYAEVEILESPHVVQAVVRDIGYETILHGGDGADPASPASPTPSWIASAIGALRSLASSGDRNEQTPFEQAVAMVEAGVAVEPVIRSDTIRLSYVNADPELAERVLDTLLAKYLERHIEVHKGGEMEAVFKPQVQQYKAALEEAEERIAALKRERGVFSFDAQRAELIHEKVSAEAQLADTRREFLTLERKVARIEEQLASHESILELPSVGDQSPGLDALRKTLVELELDRQQALQQYVRGGQDVSAIAAEIEKAEQLLAKEYARVLYTNRKNLADLRMQERTLSAEIEEYRLSLQAINVAEAENIRLERERAISEHNYLRYVKELEEARISAVMDLARITNVRVIQSAVAGWAPTGPRKSLLFALTGVLSVLLSVGAAFVFDSLDHSIKTARDVEDLLGLPVLGSIAEARR